jgi:hypothetical protein
MIISEEKLLTIIKEEIERSQVRESSAMPPASVLKGGAMPPASALGREEVETGLDISSDETLPGGLSQAQKDVLKDVSRLANIQKMFDFTRPLLTKLVQELSDIDDILGSTPPSSVIDAYEKYRNEPEFWKVWARASMGSGKLGWDSDNEQVDDLTTGVNPIENVKLLKYWMKNFDKLLKSEEDGRARSIEPHAKTLVDILTKLEAGFLMSPKLLGLTPVFKPSRAADNFGGAFPEMGDGWLGGGQFVPSIKDGDSVPSWKAGYKYKVDKLTRVFMSNSYWDGYKD